MNNLDSLNDVLYVLLDSHRNMKVYPCDSRDLINQVDSKYIETAMKLIHNYTLLSMLNDTVKNDLDFHTEELGITSVVLKLFRDNKYKIYINQSELNDIVTSVDMNNYETVFKLIQNYNLVQLLMEFQNNNLMSNNRSKKNG